MGLLYRILAIAAVACGSAWSIPSSDSNTVPSTLTLSNRGGLSPMIFSSRQLLAVSQTSSSPVHHLKHAFLNSKHLKNSNNHAALTRSIQRLSEKATLLTQSIQRLSANTPVRLPRGAKGAKGANDANGKKKGANGAKGKKKGAKGKNRAHKKSANKARKVRKRNVHKGRKGRK